jgi:hypothetical protein
MAGPKRAAEDIDAALERDRAYKQQKTGLPTQAYPETDWATSARNAQGDPEWKEDKNKSFFTTPGMWQYTTGDKPTRTWVERNAQPTLEEGAGSLNLNAPVFQAEKGDREIYHAYHELWVSDHVQEFINTIDK